MSVTRRSIELLRRKSNELVTLKEAIADAEAMSKHDGQEFVVVLDEIVVMGSVVAAHRAISAAIAKDLGYEHRDILYRASPDQVDKTAIDATKNAKVRAESLRDIEGHEHESMSFAWLMVCIVAIALMVALGIHFLLLANRGGL